MTKKYDESYCEKAEKLLATGKSLAAICSGLRIARSTLYAWRDQHPEFKEAIDIGLQHSQAYWEDVGEDGIKGNYERFASSAWIFKMKKRFKDDYGDDKEEAAQTESMLEKIINRLVTE